MIGEWYCDDKCCKNGDGRVSSGIQWLSVAFPYYCQMSPQDSSRQHTIRPFLLIHGANFPQVSQNPPSVAWPVVVV